MPRRGSYRASEEKSATKGTTEGKVISVINFQRSSSETNRQIFGMGRIPAACESMEGGANVAYSCKMYSLPQQHAPPTLDWRRLSLTCAVCEL